MFPKHLRMLRATRDPKRSIDRQGREIRGVKIIDSTSLRPTRRGVVWGANFLLSCSGSIARPDEESAPLGVYNQDKTHGDNSTEAPSM